MFQVKPGSSKLPETCSTKTSFCSFFGLGGGFLGRVEEVDGGAVAAALRGRWIEGPVRGERRRPTRPGGQAATRLNGHSHFFASVANR